LIKGLILSGGSGTRLRPLTHTSAKQLVPVANEPVIYYGIKALVKSGITEIGIIISPETGEEIKEVVGDGKSFGANITYILQDKPKGLAHAVLTAEEYLNESDFVMYLGDNILKEGIDNLVKDFSKNKPDSLVLLTEVDSPQAYGIAEIKSDKIVNLEEKPSEPKSNLALVGVYLFTSKIIEACKELKPSKRGELEITEAIQLLIDKGLNVEYTIVEDWWKDTGTVEEMLHANRLVLDTIKNRIDGDIDKSDIDGPVIIEEGARVTNSFIRGPAIIGKNALIENCYVGPNTAIDANTFIKNTEIEYSIVLSGTVIKNIKTKIEKSLIGKNVVIKEKELPPKALSFVVGENSKIEIL
jgi:glucose-1-phosphate thymidylyltransferase